MQGDCALPWTPPRNVKDPTVLAGLRYEQAVVNELLTPSILEANAEGDPKCHLYVQPTFRYWNRESGVRGRLCRPDAVVVRGWGEPGVERAFIFEIKLTHTPRAWYQLMELYRPVVGLAWGLAEERITVIEVFESMAEQFELPGPTHWLDIGEVGAFEGGDCLGLLPWRKE